MAFSSFDIVTLRKCRYSLMQIFFCLWCIFFFSLVGNLKGVFSFLFWKKWHLVAFYHMRYQQKQRHFSRRVILMEKYFVDMEQEKMWIFLGFFLRTPKRFRSPVISQTLSFRDSELDACVTNNDSSWNQLDILNVCRKLSTYLPHTKND